MMTRKDYIKTAQILHAHLRELPTNEGKNEVDTLLRTAIDFADYFEVDNPKFDRKRFMQAFIEGY